MTAAILHGGAKNAVSDSGPVLITGGAGFVATNLAHRFLANKRRVIVFDNLSRPGVKANLQWLKQRHGSLVEVEVGDVRDDKALGRAVNRAARVFHLAAQVAVTTSLDDPLYDFEVNARGTLNLLESLRRRSDPPPLVFTSTNKVYGALADVILAAGRARYDPMDENIRAHGIDEDRNLDFHSPYGCSKGAADQYVLDYARSFGIPAAVLRMSCIYGPHQWGTEDQGWVAHFLLSTLNRQSITVYGDGRQVRDLLYVEDLVDAFLLAQQHIEEISGQAFNIGGGPANAVSLLELLQRIAELAGLRPQVRYAGWRTGDQRYYVADTRRFEALTGWRPRVRWQDGVERLWDWQRAQQVPASLVAN
jgi:CDP-paratose 2-epimerase